MNNIHIYPNQSGECLCMSVCVSKWADAMYERFKPEFDLTLSIFPGNSKLCQRGSWSLVMEGPSQQPAPGSL